MNPWERRNDESDPAWEAFQLYRDMGAQRSIRDVAARLGKSATLIGRWSATHDWPNRARSFDRWMDQQTVGALADQLRALAEDANAVARAFVAKTSARLAVVEDGAPIPDDVIRSVGVVVRAQQQAITVLKPERTPADDPSGTVDVVALARELMTHGRASD